MSAAHLSDDRLAEVDVFDLLAGWRGQPFRGGRGTKHGQKWIAQAIGPSPSSFMVSSSDIRFATNSKRCQVCNNQQAIQICTKQRAGTRQELQAAARSCRHHLFETVVVQLRAEVGVAAAHDEDAVCSLQRPAHQFAQVLILAIPNMLSLKHGASGFGYYLGLVGTRLRRTLRVIRKCVLSHLTLRRRLICTADMQCFFHNKTYIYIEVALRVHATET